jgi:DNA-binding response OmpR family regulator
LAEMAEVETTGGPHRLLVAAKSTDDDISLADWLKHQGFGDMTAVNGREALQIAGSSWQPDVVVLDLTSPEGGGFAVCERVRATNQRAVIFVLGKELQEDEIRSLEAGADDYLAKPFSLKVLLVRIRAHLRRAHVTGNQRILEFGDLWLDAKNYATRVKGEWVEPQPQEFRPLMALAQSLGVPVSRRELLWRAGRSWRGASSRTVDINISRIRARVETHSDYTYIHSVRGVGYRFAPVAKEAPASSGRASPKGRTQSQDYASSAIPRRLWDLPLLGGTAL